MQIMTNLEGSGKVDLSGILRQSKVDVKQIVDCSNRAQTGKSFMHFIETDVDRFSKVD
tara:strand:- start:281 stop:454 length:174 start_codon:yes stop_codon:yes gene_type:complete